jgi:hypothetical protein
MESRLPAGRAGWLRPWPWHGMTRARAPRGGRESTAWTSTPSPARSAARPTPTAALPEWWGQGRGTVRPCSAVRAVTGLAWARGLTAGQWTGLVMGVNCRLAGRPLTCRGPCSACVGPGHDGAVRGSAYTPGHPADGAPTHIHLAAGCRLVWRRLHPRRKLRRLAAAAARAGLGRCRAGPGVPAAPRRGLCPPRPRAILAWEAAKGRHGAPARTPPPRHGPPSAAARVEWRWPVEAVVKRRWKHMADRIKRWAGKQRLANARTGPTLANIPALVRQWSNTLRAANPA